MKYTFTLLSLLGFCLWMPLELHSQSLEQLKEKAKAGDKNAQFRLGVIYQNGTLDKPNPKKAFAYFQEASLQDYDSAQFELGKMYDMGIGIEQNHIMAFRLIKLAARTEHAQANYYLGNMYESGIGTQVDKNEAVRCFLKAASLGHLEAIKKIEDFQGATFHDFGESKAVVVLKAKQGDAEAQYKYGEMYELGKEEQKNLAEAVVWYQRSAAQNFPKAVLRVGKLYYDGVGLEEDKRKAVALFLKAYNLGEESADELLTAQNLQLANMGSIDYLKYQASKGDAEKLYQLCLKYRNGQDVEQNPELAFEYVQRAASFDYEPALLTLAQMYEKGEGVPQSYENAFTCYKQAAYMNNADAAFILAQMHLEGKGTQQDTARAVSLLIRNANKGHEASAAVLSSFTIESYFEQDDLDYNIYLANNGNKEAQWRLANYYMMTNKPECVQWLERLGISSSEALFTLGNIYYNGKYGVVPNLGKAANAYQRAADLGNPDGLLALGTMYAKGQGVGGDDYLEKALKLIEEYKLAVAKDNTKQLSPEINGLMADIYFKKQNYNKSIEYLTAQINGFEEEQEHPDVLINALKNRAIAFYNLKNYQSCFVDFEIAGNKLEEYKDHSTLSGDYNFLKGEILYWKGKVTFSLGQKYKACNYFQKAEAVGYRIPEEEKKVCLEGD